MKASQLILFVVALSTLAPGPPAGSQAGWLAALLRGTSRRAAPGRPPARPGAGSAFDVSLLPLVAGEQFPTRPGRAFSAMSADIEGDGDLDLLINRHNAAPLELWRNEGGAFRWINRPGADVSGVFENRGVPYLYAGRNSQLARISAEGGPGLYIWHDPHRVGPWYFHL